MSSEGSLDTISPVHRNVVLAFWRVFLLQRNLLALWMNFAAEAEGPLVVMVVGELLAIVSPTWVKVVQISR